MSGARAGRAEGARERGRQAGGSDRRSSAVSVSSERWRQRWSAAVNGGGARHPPPWLDRAVPTPLSLGRDESAGPRTKVTDAAAGRLRRSAQAEPVSRRVARASLGPATRRLAPAAGAVLSGRHRRCTFVLRTMLHRDAKGSQPHPSAQAIGPGADPHFRVSAAWRAHTHPPAPPATRPGDLHHRQVQPRDRRARCSPGWATPPCLPNLRQPPNSSPPRLVNYHGPEARVLRKRSSVAWFAHHEVFELVGRPFRTLGARAFRLDH